MKFAKLFAAVSRSDGTIPITMDETVAIEIDILLLTEGIITDTESLTGSVKKIMMITRT
jgi:hypothetical protein